MMCQLPRTWEVRGNSVMSMTSTNIPPLTQRPAWKALEAHYQALRDVHLRDLFQKDPERGTRLTAQQAGLYFDYSKNRITDETLRLLLDLARECGLVERRDAMFRGEKINVTENRAVLHIALRAPRDAHIYVDGQDVVPAVHAVLDKMSNFAERVRSGEWRGYTGKRIRNIINIGIGGSDLGPVMAYEALKWYTPRDLTFRFISNIDGTDFVEDGMNRGNDILTIYMDMRVTRGAQGNMEYRAIFSDINFLAVKHRVAAFDETTFAGKVK